MIPEIEKKLIERSNEIGFEFFNQLNQLNSGETNLLISPAGISFSLYALFESSDNETKNGIKKYFKLANMPDSSISQGFDNLQLVFSEIDKSTQYSNSLDFAFKHNIKLDDRFINFLGKRKFLKATFGPNSGFVDDETNVKTEYGYDGFQVINQVGFSSWGKFQKKIEESPFYYNPDKSDFVQMIVSESDFKFYGDANIKAVELPLGKGNFNLLIILPNSLEFLSEFANGLNMKLLRKIQEKSKEQHIEVFMPKIDISSMQSYNSYLKDCKLDFMNKPQVSDFSIINKDLKFYLSDFEQLLDLKVQYQSTKERLKSIDETENSKLTGSSLFIDHPFIMVIYEKYSNAVLFIGKVQHP
jgi:serpin B